MLTDPERRVLAVYCFDHAVAVCAACQRTYKLSELGEDIMGRRYYVCPWCRMNLLDQVRVHILTCSEIMAALQDRIAQSQHLLKTSETITTQSAVLAAESHELACRVVETLRNVSHAPANRSAVVRIAAALVGCQNICAACAGVAAGVSGGTVLRHLDALRAHLRIFLHWGRCSECERPGVLVMSLTEDDRAAQ